MLCVTGIYLRVISDSFFSPSVLLLSMNHLSVCCSFLSFFLVLFRTILKGCSSHSDFSAAAGKIRSLIMADSRDNDPSWLYCIPLLHFLWGESKPFQQPTPSGDHRNDKWWGIQRLEAKVETFKNSTSVAAGWSV